MKRKTFYSVNYKFLANKLSLTSANLSNLAKSSFRVLTNSGAGHVDEMAVKPTMSANKMLVIREE